MDIVFLSIFECQKHHGTQEGDVVELGQELCVVEALKMQNVIRSHKAGATVGKLFGKVGSSLRADEILLEFELEAGSEAT